MRQCFIQEDQLDEWSGTLEAFSFIEEMVYLGYIFTLLILMAKSRFMKTSIDNSEAFEETYMSYMCNKICSSILSNPKIQKNPEIFQPILFCDREKIIDFGSVELKIKLTDLDFHRLKKKLE